MFISKMIKLAESGDLELWNDGASLRDFIHARDVARFWIDSAHAQAPSSQPRPPRDLART